MGEKLKDGASRRLRNHPVRTQRQKLFGIDCDELYAYYTAAGMSEEASTLDMRGTTTETYGMYLMKMVDEARATEATPVLVSPVCRCWLNKHGKLPRQPRHDLGDKHWVLTQDGILKDQKVGKDDHSYDYPHTMCIVADELGVPFIDLTTATAELYESYGPGVAQETFFVPGDNTHYNETGASTIAKMCVELMLNQGVLTDALVKDPPSSITDHNQTLSSGNEAMSVFDLAGRQLTSEPRQGIYFKGGRKYVK